MADKPHTDHPTSPADDQVTVNTSSKLPHLPHRRREVDESADPKTNDAATSTPDPAVIEKPASNTLFHQPSSNHQLQEEDVDLSILPKKTHTVRAAATTVVGLVLLVGLAATWFKMNEGTYSLTPTTQVADSNQLDPTDSPATLGAETNANKTLSLDLKLPRLKQGHYQAWLTHDEQTHSLGAFKPVDNQAQTLDDQEFAPTTNITKGDVVFITVEAGDATVEQPSTTIILSGEIDNNSQAKLSFTAVDLSDASGSFMLAAATDSGADPKSGVWFARADGQKLGEPSLKLPNAPTGWKYEGQAVYKGVAVEIGRFSRPDQADGFNKFTPKPENTPKVPGEDFLQKPPGQLGLEFPTDLSTGDWKIIISLEPDHDGQDPTGSDTFYLQPLSAEIPQSAEAYKDYKLTRDLSKFPTGTATFQ